MENEYRDRRFSVMSLQNALPQQTPRCALSVDRCGRRSAHRRCRGLAAVEPCDARLYPAGGICAARRTVRADGPARRVRAAPGACRRQAVAQPLYRGQPVAGADARSRAGRTRRARDAGERDRAVACHARSDRRRADRQPAGSQGTSRAIARARHQASLSTISAPAFPASAIFSAFRSTGSRSTGPSSRRSATRRSPAPSSSRSWRSVRRSA